MLIERNSLRNRFAIELQMDLFPLSLNRRFKPMAAQQHLRASQAMAARAGKTPILLRPFAVDIEALQHLYQASGGGEQSRTRSQDGTGATSRFWSRSACSWPETLRSPRAQKTWAGPLVR